MAAKTPPKKRARKRAARTGKDPLRVAQGNVLRSWRRRRKEKLSQEQLAAKAGLSLNVIGDLERGARSISAREFIKICHALEVPFDVLQEDVKIAQAAVLRAIDEEIKREMGESLPEEARSPAAEPSLILGESGEQGMFFYGVARFGDPDAMVQAFGKFLRQHVPIPGKSDEEPSR